MSRPRQGVTSPCIVLASVGAAWSRAVLPASLNELLDFHFVEPSDAARSVSATTAELAAAAEQLDARPIVSGISMNGTVALAAAAEHPDTFGGVIAITAPPQLPPDRSVTERYAYAVEPERQREFNERRAVAEAAAEGSSEELRLWRRADAVRRWHDWTFDPTDLDALATANPAWMTAVMADGESYDWMAALDAIRCPVFLALGRSDFVVPPICWDLAALPATFTAEVFDRSGHTPCYEQPEEFAASVRRWLATVTA